VAAFLLLLLAAGGGAVVFDLLRENTSAGQVTVLHQTVGGYPQGWLLAAATALGFAVAMLLVASWRAAERRGGPRRGPGHRTVEPEPDRDRLLDEFFGPDAAPRHLGPSARSAQRGGDRRQGQARYEQGWDPPGRAGHRPEARSPQAMRTARLHDHTDLPFPAREGRRR
jgi:hypothetical protein